MSTLNKSFIYLLICGFSAIFFNLAGCGCDQDGGGEGGSDHSQVSVAIDPQGGLFNEPVEATITAENAQTAHPMIYFTMDGSDPAPNPNAQGTTRAASPVQVTIYKDTLIKFVAVDGSDHKSETGEAEFLIDTLAPTTTIKPAPGIYGAAQNLTISAKDDRPDGVMIYYTLDGSDPVVSTPTGETGSTLTGAAPVENISIPVSTEVRYLAVDEAGNAGEIASAVYVIDETIPEATANPAGKIFKDSVEVTLSATDELTVFPEILYTMDGTDPSPDSSTTYRGATPLSATISETTTLKFTARDEAGNMPTIKAEVYTLDVEPPATAASPTGRTYNDVLSVTLTATDDISAAPTIYYTLDGSEPFVGGPVTHSGASPIEDLDISSDTVLKFFAVDEAGNIEFTKTEIYLLDLDGPTVTADPRSGSFHEPQAVSLTATDDFPGPLTIYYTTDGTIPNPGQPGTHEGLSPISGIVVDDSITLTFFARDIVGNDGPQGSETYVIDDTAPYIAVDPTTYLLNAPQLVTLEATDDHTAFPIIYYTLDGTDPWPGQPGTLMGSSPIQFLLVTSNLLLRLFAVDDAGNVSKVLAVQYTVDILDPIAWTDPPGGPFNTPLWVTLNCADMQTGCMVFYTTDGSDPTPASPSGYPPLMIFIDADTTVKFYAADMVDNASDIQTEIYSMDLVPPETTVDPGGGAYDFPMGVTLTAVDDLTANPMIYFTTNGVIPVPGSPWTNSGFSPVTVNLEAATVIYFLAVDEAGNQEAVKEAIYVSL